MSHVPGEYWCTEASTPGPGPTRHTVLSDTGGGGGRQAWTALCSSEDFSRAVFLSIVRTTSDDPLKLNILAKLYIDTRTKVKYLRGVYNVIEK